MSAATAPSRQPSVPFREPPNDRNAERAIIGSSLRDNLSILELSEKIKPTDFYTYANQVIWATITETYLGKGRPVDLVTLASALHERKTDGGAPLLDEIGGPKYLAQLWDDAPVVCNAPEYARIVRHKAMLRELYHAGNELLRRSYDPSSDPDELIAESAKMIFDVHQRSYATRAVTMDDAVCEFIDSMDRRMAGFDKSEVIPSGWKDFDYLTGGFYRDELTILAARPSIGKTVAALNVAENAATLGHRVLFSSLEQSRKDLAMRLMCWRANVSSTIMRKGDLTEIQLERIKDSAIAAKDHNRFMTIDDSHGQTLAHIAAQARRQKMRAGLDLLVVDYMQLVKPASHEGTRNDQVAAISAGLKEIAKELHIPVIALSQMNRDSAKRGNGLPQLSDLRDSGAIEQDADTVAFLHPIGEPDKQAEFIEIKILVEKQRNGPKGEVLMDFHRTYFRISDHIPNQRGGW